MMLLTHVLVGLLLAVPVAVAVPSLAGPAAVGGIVGGFLPDLDLLGGHHRKTLHFPVLGHLSAGIGVAVALLVPGPLTVSVALAGLAFVVHSASDALGGGRELRPWERTNTDAVYDHYRGQWLPARYLVPYDGHPRDLLVAALAALPVLAVYDGPVRWIAVGALLVGTVYTLVRKRVPKYLEPVVE